MIMLLKCHGYHKAKWYIASVMTLEYAVCYVCCNGQIINNIWSFLLTFKCHVYQRKYNFNIILTVIAKCMIYLCMSLPYCSFWWEHFNEINKSIVINENFTTEICPKIANHKCLVFWMYETSGTVMLSSSRSKAKIP